RDLITHPGAPRSPTASNPVLVAGHHFFFQAEDGIRDRNVTGVQTCALPISPAALGLLSLSTAAGAQTGTTADRPLLILVSIITRSEERRVGKEWRSRGAP